MRFLAIGECMAELSKTSIENQYHLGYAGDTFNTAWYFTQLQPNLNVSFLTAVGSDAISEQMCKFIESSGISTQYIQTVEGGAVGLYLISLVDGERSFTYWRKDSAATQLANDAQALTSAMGQSDLIYFSGITLAILNNSSRNTLLSHLRLARESGKTIAFDPNLRPRLWASTQEMCDSIMLGASVSDIVLPSYEDEAEWFHDSDPTQTVYRYQELGSTTIIVKDGANRVQFADDDCQGSVEVTAIANIVDTTAAGDSFNAGFLAHRYMAQLSLEASIERACSLAGQVVQAPGALVRLEI